MILFILAILTVSCAIRFHGVRSLVTMGVLGVIIYAVPAIFEVTAPQQLIPTGGERYFIKPSDQTIYAYWAYFLFMIVNLIFFGIRRRCNSPVIASPQAGVNLALTTCLVAWYVVCALNDGPLFFLKGRFEVTGSVVEMILKWSIPLSIFYGIITDKPIRFLGYLFLIMQFLVGDRTVLAITMAGAAYLYLPELKGFVHYFRLKYFLIASGLLFLIIFGKPIYLVIKAGDLDYMYRFFDVEVIMLIVQSFEPISIFNHFDFTVREGLWMEVDVFLKSVFGNFLLVPSFFDISTNQTNIHLMSAYPNIITNGIGGSYLANAWMVLRVPGLYVFSLIFVGSLSLLDSYTKRKSPLVVSVIILFGALIAVYSHRNGLGNLLSFVRQIAISGAIIVVLTAFFKLFYARRGY